MLDYEWGKIYDSKGRHCMFHGSTFWGEGRNRRIVSLVGLAEGGPAAMYDDHGRPVSSQPDGAPSGQLSNSKPVTVKQLDRMIDADQPRRELDLAALQDNPLYGAF